MTSSRAILILTADAGSGHRSAARALGAAFERLYPGQAHVTIINPIRHPRAGRLLQLYERLYLDIVQHAPALYQLTYAGTDLPVVSSLLAGAVHLLLRDALRDIVRQHPADLVIGVFPILTSIVAAASPGGAARPALMSVVTDLGAVHRTWFSRRDDRCVVPGDRARGKAIACGLEPGRVVVAGIPVHPDFSAPRADRATLRRELGWLPDVPALLLLGGGAGVRQLAPLARAVDAAGLPIQLAIVAGANDDLADELRAHRWSLPTQVYGFVPLADLMHAADIVATKAGGLSVSEALAAGRPLLIHSVTPGQEQGNMTHVCASGAGQWAPDPERFVAHVRRWLEHPAELRRAATAAQHMGQPQAALAIARLGWELAQAGPARAQPR